MKKVEISHDLYTLYEFVLDGKYKIFNVGENSLEVIIGIKGPAFYVLNGNYQHRFNVILKY